MKTIDRIVERSAASLPGATTPLLHAELYAMLTDFCKQSRAWRHLFKNLTTQNYVLELDNEAIPGRVLGVIGAIAHDGRPVFPTAGRLRSDFAPSLTPTHYCVTTPSFTHVEFFPPPTRELDNLEVLVYLGPEEGACELLPVQLLNLHEDALVAGMEGRMMLKPKKPYSDAKLGAMKMAEYRMGVKQARIQASKGHTTAPAPWRFPMFA